MHLQPVRRMHSFVCTDRACVHYNSHSAKCSLGCALSNCGFVGMTLCELTLALPGLLSEFLSRASQFLIPGASPLTWPGRSTLVHRLHFRRTKFKTENDDSNAPSYNFEGMVSSHILCAGKDTNSYKRVKGRSHTAEKRISMHPHKPHATSQPSRFSHTPRLSTDSAHNQHSH